MFKIQYRLISLLALLGYCCPFSLCFAQESIPIGTWRAHISYNSIHAVVATPEKIYGAASNGIMVLNVSDKSMESYNKLNGLSGSDISALNFSDATGHLIITYADGNIDVIKDNRISNFSQLKTSATITGSKKINHISIRDGLAYLAADYGLVVFDTERLEVKETWRDLSSAGTTLKILQSTFKGDSIFLATENGVIAGDLSDNLMDFNKWKRFQTGNMNATVQAITFFNEKVYAAISSSGLYSYENGVWTQENFLQNVPLQSLHAALDRLFIAQATRIWTLDTSGELNEVTSHLIVYPQAITTDETGDIWIGDMRHGLVSNAEGNFVSYLLNGPSFSDAFRLTYQNNTLFAVHGGYMQDQPLHKAGMVDVFSSMWESVETPLEDITDIQVRGATTFASSFGGGIQAGNLISPETIYNASNSPLTNTDANGDSVNITALAASDDGIWIANYDAESSLHLLTNDNTWQSFSFQVLAAQYPVEVAVDYYRNVWMVLDPSKGGGIIVFNKEENRRAYLTEVIGSGGLPDRAVRSIAMDLEGSVWVGTDKGVSYFTNPFSVFEPGADGIEPVFESRYLLREDMVTAMAVDGGNRKWIGTERGVWLFNPTGEELIYNFTEENSPLLSNVIRDIEINPATGEVFFATSKGIVSFRSDATEAEPFFQDVKIFPNPVTADFNGTIGISGLAADAFVKITDISGKLVWQTRANGGTASWNGSDYNGRKACTGIYLVFSSSEDGSESFVGKIAVIK